MTAAERYHAAIAAKTRIHGENGMTPADIHPALFDFQIKAASWALRKGRAALFAGTGLGKTMMMGEFVRQIEGRRLIVAPLAVSFQIQKELRRLGIDAKTLDSYGPVADDGVYIINYDRLCVSGVKWDAIVLDESSIIKNYTGATYKTLCEELGGARFRLACTATPSPNDFMELGTHAEFLGVCSRMEMLATFFTHDGGDTSKWRLKRHARADFWRWVASWALIFEHPSDLGCSANGYDLPPLHVHRHFIESQGPSDGLFAHFDGRATSLYGELNKSHESRAAHAVRLAGSNPFLFWCNTNKEQESIERMAPGIASVKGSTDRDEKARLMLGFASGDITQLVTKPKIAGFGMNWQQCADMAFVGTTFSFEQTYQAIRRCYRFGQTHPVNVHMICDEHMAATIDALDRKQDRHQSMVKEAIQYAEL